MSVTELWRAVLNPSSSRYLEWRKIFDTDTVPLQSPFPIKAKINGVTEMVHVLDWDAIDGPTSDRLYAYIAEKFGVTELDVAKQVEEDAAFPIRAADVIVTMSPRSFI